MSAYRDARMFEYLQQQVLTRDEKVVWSGRPDPARCAVRELPIFGFGAVFLAFSVFWMAGALWMGAGAFALFGLPFVAVGGWIVSAPIRNLAKARRTYYAITDKRVIILIGGQATRTVAIGPAEIDRFDRVDHANGTTSFRLRQTVGRSSRGSSHSMTGFTDGLWGVRDAKPAADAIAALRRAREVVADDEWWS